MNKDVKQLLNGISTVAFIFLGFKIWQESFSDNWTMFFVIFVIAGTLPTIVLSRIPTKNTKDKNKKSKSNASSSKKNTEIKNGQSKQHNLLRTEKEILTLPLDELSWREFEELCYLYYKGKGHKVEETPEGPDGGVDLIVHNRHHKAKVAVQIKHRKSGNQVTVKEIRELNSAKRNHGCQLADFITTSTYTNVALQEADKFKIETRDKYWIENNILKWRDLEAKKRNLA